MSTDYTFGHLSDSQSVTADTPRNTPSVPVEKSATVFDIFRQEMNHPAVRDTQKTYLVEGRENFGVIYSTELDFDILQRYLKRHTKKNAVSVLPLAYDLLILLNRGFSIKGEIVTDDTGDQLTFVSEVFLDMCNKLSSREAISWVYGSDAAILGALNQLLSDCGYQDLGAQEQGDEDFPTSRR